MLVLASQSPRRVELLSHLGVEFKQHSADIDESTIKGETPQDYVLRLAKAKANAVLSHYPDYTWVLGSDTTVVCDQQILGKPSSLQEARDILTLLSGKEHQVYTAVALVCHHHSYTTIVCTDVRFKTLTLAEIDQYWATGEPCDKAGAYGIQGIGGKFVIAINGSFSNVVGLPLFETAQLLKQAQLAE